MNKSINNSNQIKVLEVLGGGESIGGVEKMLLNYFDHMDTSKFIIDFCFVRKSTFGLLKNTDREYLINGNIFELNAFKGRSNLSGYFKVMLKIINVIQRNKYDIVHVNAGRPALLVVGLLAALFCRVKIRIVHSHSMAVLSKNNIVNRLCVQYAYKILNRFFCRYSTLLFACSKEAAQYMFGHSVFDNKKYISINNAIDVNEYTFNQDIRIITRSALGVSNDEIIIGHIGRFSKEKNHEYLIDIFSEIENIRKDIKLWLVGDGELKEQIQQKVRFLGLEDKVLFLGERSDVPCLLNAMDLVIFPSIYEGLSVTLVEAQASSLPIIASSNISEEHKMIDVFAFLDLNKGSMFWANCAISIINRLYKRKSRYFEIQRKGYNINIEAKKLENLFLKSVISK